MDYTAWGFREFVIELERRDALDHERTQCRLCDYHSCKNHKE